MSEHIVYGEGTPFRRAGLVERIAARFGRHPVARRLHPAFDRLLWISTMRRGLKAVLPQGEIVRLIPSCRHMRWNLEEYRAFRAATPVGATVLDVGANVGAYTLLFAQWVGPRGRVVAFEPVPGICDLLRAEVALNHVADRVEIVNAAATCSNGVAAMIAPGPVGINRVVTTMDPGLLQVPSVTLDDFCIARGIRPTVIKIDVEGVELDTLRGARQTLASSDVAAVFVEWHPSIWPSLSVSAADLEHELASQHLRAEPLRAGDDVWKVEGICARVVRG